jgi:RNA polymerase Rpb8
VPTTIGCTNDRRFLISTATPATASCSSASTPRTVSCMCSVSRLRRFACIFLLLLVCVLSSRLVFSPSPDERALCCSLTHTNTNTLTHLLCSCSCSFLLFLRSNISHTHSLSESAFSCAPPSFPHSYSQIYASFGGLMMMLEGDPRNIQSIELDEHIYLLMRTLQ